MITTLTPDILAHAEKYLPATGSPLCVSKIEKGGSGREFFRIAAETGESLIIVRYNDSREENRHYVAIAAFLATAGVNVPKMYLHAPDASYGAHGGLILMQDLGTRDLHSYRSEPWELLYPLYDTALRQIVRLHSHPEAAIVRQNLDLQKEFNESLYRWEQGYFFEHCLGRTYGLPPDTLEKFYALPALSHIARHLASLSRTLVHRDFQSQNILIYKNDAWFIDFQGMRLGLPQYDLASLIYDPYVPLDDSARQQLIGSYKTHALATGLTLTPDFDHILDLCAIQRLMQALGAYGNLGLAQGKRDFLPYITPARRSLEKVLHRVPELVELLALLHSLPSEQ